jgi:hypothetical protein
MENNKLPEALNRACICHLIVDSKDKPSRTTTNNPETKLGVFL